MKVLNEIKSKIAVAEARTSIQVDKLRIKAFKRFKKLLDGNKAISTLVSQVESSRELVLSEEGYPVQWTRVDFSVLGLDLEDKFYRDLLSEYFEEFHVGIDFENDCLTMDQGPALVIQDDDVYDQDSGKRIISRDQYETREELNSLIEAHMDSTGYFPSVIRVDRHGNAFYVNTTNQVNAEVSK